MKVRVFASVICLVAVTAHAEGKRYLVKFKSQSTFNSVVAQMRQNSPAFFQNPRVSEFQVFSQMTKSTEALENIGLLVVETDSQAAALQNNPQVEFVEEEIMHPLPHDVVIARAKKPNPDDDGNGNSGNQDSNATIPTPWGITAVKAPQAWKVTQGENARVMVLDTGVDQGHPALQGQIEKVQNFIGDQGGPTDVTDSVGHGTHVSGTILANGKNGGLVGVAPKAKLLMGRVCATEGCSSVAIAEGVNWAVSEKVQVLSLSLGGPASTPAETQAFQLAEQSGVMVVAASGNDSAAKVSFPGALPTVLAIGAVDENLNKADFSNWGPELGVMAPGVDVFSSVPRGAGRDSKVTESSTVLQSMQFDGSPVGKIANIDLAYGGFGSQQELAGVSLRGKIALIQRGNNIPFRDKALNAISAGAVAVVIYNNKDGLDNGTVAQDGQEVAVPTIMITQKDGQALQQALASGQAPKLSISVNATDYAVYQGTSMATPHVAGVAALVRSANSRLSPAQVRAIIKGTAHPLTPNDQNQTGSGFVDAAAAVQKALTTNPEEVKLANGF